MYFLSFFLKKKENSRFFRLFFFHKADFFFHFYLFQFTFSRNEKKYQSPIDPSAHPSDGPSDLSGRSLMQFRRELCRATVSLIHFKWCYFRFVYGDQAQLI